MLLETPKSEGKPRGAIAVDPQDARNLATLRRLMGGAESAAGGGQSPP